MLTASEYLVVEDFLLYTIFYILDSVGEARLQHFWKLAIGLKISYQYDILLINKNVENIKTVTYKGRKIWKKQMKSYYLKRKIKTIGKHINNVLKEELDNQVVVAKFTTVQNEGTTMLVNSEFVALLKQANTDSSKRAAVIGVSDAQLRFVTKQSVQ